MNRMVIAICVLMVLVGSASAEDKNLIGLVSEVDCQLGSATHTSDCFAELYCGVQEIYLVLWKPWNDALDQAITNVGGFECKLVLPDGFYLLGAQLPPNSVNFKTLPEFFVGTNVPVVGDQTLLVTITVMVPEYVGDTLFAQLTPVHQTYQSIPGRLAITDANDGFSLQAVDAYGPAGISDDYTDAMVYFGDPQGQGLPCVVPNTSESWGSLKADYR